MLRPRKDAGTRSRRQNSSDLDISKLWFVYENELEQTTA
jgi:hypothetical protein